MSAKQDYSVTLRSGVPRESHCLVNDKSLAVYFDKWIFLLDLVVVVDSIGLKNLFLANLSIIGCLSVAA